MQKCFVQAKVMTPKKSINTLMHYLLKKPERDGNFFFMELLSLQQLFSKDRRMVSGVERRFGVWKYLT